MINLFYLERVDKPAFCSMEIDHRQRMEPRLPFKTYYSKYIF